mgnify:CR=1 FL=1
MTDRETELHRLAAELRDHETIDDAFLAKSFTDRHLIVDVSDDTVPEAVAKRLAEHDLYGADEVYGDETDARSFAGTVGDGIRLHFVDVRTRDSHQSYVID